MIHRLAEPIATDHDVAHRLEQTLRPRAIIADGESASAIVFAQTVELAVDRRDLEFLLCECQEVRLFGGDYRAVLERDLEGRVCMVQRGETTFLVFVIEPNF